MHVVHVPQAVYKSGARHVPFTYPSAMANTARAIIACSAVLIFCTCSGSDAVTPDSATITMASGLKANIKVLVSPKVYRI